MTIGALSAYGAQTYVYNANMLSSASMNKLSKISDNVLDKKIDYNELTDESKNVNPLKKGQTLDFQSMLAMQMQRGQNNAARVMKPVQETQAAADETEQVQSSGAVVAQFDQAAAQSVKTAEAAAGQGAADMTDTGSNVSYQMQQALNAYGMFMTA
ncbi:MAG: hypothetical protein HDR17_11100 [Lachnospiraceae bacterium]|nr:hypothetical protein [Lachnospiraceae bacterium]